MFRLVPLVAAIALVVGSGVVNGLWSGRWTESRTAVIQAAAARLKTIPLEFGDWTGKEEPFDVKDYAAAGIDGATLRRYQNSRTGEMVTMMIVCGRPGPISVHTPDVCYPGSGFQILSERLPTRVPLGEGTPPAEFWTLRMAKPATVGTARLNVSFSWSTDGSWEAPERDARFVFATSPVLFKLYAIREVPQSTEETDAQAPVTEDDPIVQFLKDLVPAMRGSLFEAPAATS